jgi:hypothetical protein
MIKPQQPRNVKPTQLPISRESQELLLDHVRRLHSFFAVTFSVRTRMEQIDRAYQREDDFSTEHLKSRIANRYGDKLKLQHMTVPVIQPQVDSMQAYLAGVFLTGTPLFGVVADAADEDAAQMYETIIEENSRHTGWARELSIFFKDILKYNIGAVEAAWKQETIYSLDTSMQMQNGQPKQVQGLWEGNALKRIDLYNAGWDTRVAPNRMHIDGEFFWYTEPMSATRLKQFIQDLDGRIAANVNDTLGGAADFSTMGNAGGGKFYIPQINKETLIPHPIDGVDWFQVAGLTSEGTNKIPTINAVSTYYLRIIPDNFNMAVPQKRSPQIWKLIVVNNTHIIYAERETNVHNYLGVVMAQPLDDGLNYQTKSYAQNSQDYQDISTAIWNASLSAQRRAVYDRIFYDPSRIRKEDINNSSPIARIPVKASAYGKPVSDAYSHASFTNDQFSFVMQQLGAVNNMANIAQGSNPAQQGQFVKGNKTQHEFDTVMGNSNIRQQMLALFLESSFFYVIKQIIKLNIMQYATDGKIFSINKKQSVNVDVVALRTKAVEFEVSDGMLPTDRLIDADTFQVMLQTIAASPDLNVEFDLPAMVIYYFKTQGAKNLDQFKRTPEQQQAKLAQMQQAAQASQGGAQPQQQQAQQIQQPQQ